MDNKKRQRQVALFLGDEEIALGLITEARARALVEQRKAVWRRGQAAVQLIPESLSPSENHTSHSLRSRKEDSSAAAR